MRRQALLARSTQIRRRASNLDQFQKFAVASTSQKPSRSRRSSLSRIWLILPLPPTRLRGGTGSFPRRTLDDQTIGAFQAADDPRRLHDVVWTDVAIGECYIALDCCDGHQPLGTRFRESCGIG
jgi:hypothetical protein